MKKEEEEEVSKCKGNTHTYLDDWFSFNNMRENVEDGVCHAAAVTFEWLLVPQVHHRLKRHLVDNRKSQ